MGPPLFVRCISRHSQSHASNVSAPTMSLPGPEQHTSGLLIPTPTTLLLLCFTGENRQANCALRPPSCAAIARMAISPKGDSADSPVDFEVFLGGSCGSHMWRRDTAIPVLEESGISYYNPQLEEGAWHSGLIAIEAEAKEKATVLMFVVDGVTRGMASMIEVTAAVMSGRAAVIVVEHVPEGAVIAGDFVSDNERKDLNRARDYLVQVVEQKMKEGYTNIQLCSNISEASQQAALLAKELRDSATLSCHGSCH